MVYAWSGASAFCLSTCGSIRIFYVLQQHFINHAGLKGYGRWNFVNRIQQVGLCRHTRYFLELKSPHMYHKNMHVLVCITRKEAPPENDMVLVLASKLTWLLCRWSK